MNKQLKNRIQESGNNLHLDVAHQLSKAGWSVDMSSYYVDDISTAPREIDIIAKKSIDVAKRTNYEPDMGFFTVTLLIECKYFKNDIAFRLLDSNNDESSEAIVAVSMDKPRLIGPEFNAFRTHHYFQTKIAKLHDAEEKSEERSVFDAITQPIKSLIYQIERFSGERGLYYPVSVYKGIDGIYAIENPIKDLDEAVKEQHILYGVNYAYRRPSDRNMQKQMFYVDFVHEKSLSDYLSLIDNEIEEVRNSLRSIFVSKLKNRV